MGIVPTTGIIRKFYEEALEYEIEFTSSAFWQIWLQRAFYELDIYGFVCEYSADQSRKRTDTAMRRYDPDHHTLSSMKWHEAKRPGVGSREVERQAQDVCQRCIINENLLFIYAMTTIGLSFRLWRVDKNDMQLRPFTIEGFDVPDRYIQADSDDAWIMNTFVEHVKAHVPLRDAGILPNQAHLLPATFGNELGERSMQGHHDILMSFDPAAEQLGFDTTAEQMGEAEYVEHA
jgi:hypothetical protein